MNDKKKFFYAVILSSIFLFLLSRNLPINALETQATDQTGGIKITKDNFIQAIGEGGCSGIPLLDSLWKKMAPNSDICMDEPTPTPTPQTTPGPDITGTPAPNPTVTQPPDIPDIPDKEINDLYLTIVRYCGKNNKLDRFCLNLIKPHIDNKFVSKMQDEFNNGYVPAECVGFVKAVYALKNITLAPAWGAAINYSTPLYKPAGFEFIKNPCYKYRGKDLCDLNPPTPIRVGDAPIWDDNKLGHIAYVVEVLDTKKFRVIEANYSARGRVGTREPNMQMTNLVGWLHKL